MVSDPKTGTVILLSGTESREGPGMLYQFKGSELTRVVDVGSQPVSVNRPDDRPGIYVTSCDEILYLPDDSSAPRARIPLNRSPGSRSGNRRAKRLRGCADELLAILGHKKLAITLRNRKGKSVRKLAIVDLNSNSVEQVIMSRRRLKLGEKVAKVTLLSPLLLTPDPWLWVRAFAGDFINLSLTASPNGEFVYVLDNDADLGTVRGTVTIVRSEDSTVVNQVRLRAKGQKILFVPGGRFVYVQTPKAITLIDPRTGKKHVRHKAGKAEVRSLQLDEANGRVLALTTKSLFVFDALTGKRLMKIDGFAEPRQLLIPSLESRNE